MKLKAEVNASPSLLPAACPIELHLLPLLQAAGPQLCGPQRGKGREFLPLWAPAAQAVCSPGPLSSSEGQLVFSPGA